MTIKRDSSLPVFLLIAKANYNPKHSINKLLIITSNKACSQKFISKDIFKTLESIQFSALCV